MLENWILRPSTFRDIITDLAEKSENIESVDILRPEVGLHLVTAKHNDRQYPFLVGLHKDRTKIVAILPFKQVSPDIKEESEQKYNSLVKDFDRGDSRRYVISTDDGIICLISIESIFEESIRSYLYEAGFVESWLRNTLKSIQETGIDYEVADEVNRLLKLQAAFGEERELFPPILPRSS